MLAQQFGIFAYSTGVLNTFLPARRESAAVSGADVRAGVINPDEPFDGLDVTARQLAQRLTALNCGYDPALVLNRFDEIPTSCSLPACLPTVRWRRPERRQSYCNGVGRSTRAQRASDRRTITRTGRTFRPPVTRWRTTDRT